MMLSKGWSIVLKEGRVRCLILELRRELLAIESLAASKREADATNTSSGTTITSMRCTLLLQLLAPLQHINLLFQRLDTIVSLLALLLKGFEIGCDRAELVKQRMILRELFS